MEPVQLAELVQRGAERRVPGVGEVAPGVLRGSHGVVPRVVGLEDLRPVDEALAAVGHEIRLARAPGCERLGPLRGPLEVEASTQASMTPQ